MSGELALAGSFLKYFKRIGNIVPRIAAMTIAQVNAKATTITKAGRLC